MSETEAALLTAIDSLRALTRPTAVIHVGAGAGTGPAHAWRRWGTARGWLIDAQEARLAWAGGAGAEPGIEAVCAVLGPARGVSPFFNASNPAESGLFPAEELVGLWPNLRTTRSEERVVQPLDDIVPAASLAQDVTWIIVDCCPAVAVLEGAGAVLEQCDAALLRVLRKPLPGAGLAGVTLAEAEVYLAARGWRLVHVGEANHPDVALALFARPVAAAASGQLARLPDLTARLAATAARIAALESELQGTVAALSQARADGGAAAEQLTACQGDLAALRPLPAQLATAQAERDQHLRAVTERDARIAGLQRENETLQQRSAQLQAELSQQTGHVEHLGREAKALSDAVSQRTQALEAARQATAATESAKAVLTQEVSALRTEVASLREQMQAAAGECAALPGLRADLTRLEADLTRVTAERDAQAARAERLDRLEADLTQARAHAATLEAVKVELEKKLAHTAEQSQALAADKATLASAARTHEQQAAEHAQAARAWEVEKDRLGNTIKELTIQLETARTAARKIALEHAETAGTLEALRSEAGQARQQQRMFEDEMLRAEVQLELIRDVLLKDGGL
ncbi:MAG: hypothetical protein ACXU8N_14895 [Telluria sp.]